MVPHLAPIGRQRWRGASRQTWIGQRRGGPPAASSPAPWLMHRSSRPVVVSGQAHAPMHHWAWLEPLVQRCGVGSDLAGSPTPKAWVEPVPPGRRGHRRVALAAPGVAAVPALLAPGRPCRWRGGLRHRASVGPRLTDLRFARFAGDRSTLTSRRGMECLLTRAQLRTWCRAPSHRRFVRFWGPVE